MKTFIQWAEDVQLLDEKTKRDIGFWQYPTAYYSAQQPALAKMPANADGLFKMGPQADNSNLGLKPFRYKGFDQTEA